MEKKKKMLSEYRIQTGVLKQSALIWTKNIVERIFFPFSSKNHSAPSLFLFLLFLAENNKYIITSLKYVLGTTYIFYVPLFFVHIINILPD